MKSKGTDIDIDVANREQILSKLDFVYASMRKDGEVVKHNTGVYFNPIPVNPFTQLATLDYEEADEVGYLKIDILNVHVYKDVRNEAHLLKLMEKEPNWALLESKEFVEQLFHVSSYYDLLATMKPRSIEQLAAFLAIIRPGKKHLQNHPWERVLRDAWIKPEDDSVYYYKKSHSISYSMAVAVHMNLLEEKMTKKE